ncbi:hypothetical protein V8F06_008411 [Rhypophila decipiens]
MSLTNSVKKCTEAQIPLSSWYRLHFYCHEYRSKNPHVLEAMAGQGLSSEPTISADTIHPGSTERARSISLPPLDLEYQRLGGRGRHPYPPRLARVLSNIGCSFLLCFISHLFLLLLHLPLDHIIIATTAVALACYSNRVWGSYRPYLVICRFRISYLDSGIKQTLSTIKPERRLSSCLLKGSECVVGA